MPDPIYDSIVSSFAFFSIGEDSASPSAFRFPLFESSAGVFFFFLTIDVKSVTTAGAAGGSDVLAPSSLSNALAASSGAEKPKFSLGEDLSSSTCSE